MPHVNGSWARVSHGFGRFGTVVGEEGWLGVKLWRWRPCVELHTCQVLQPLAALGNFLARSGFLDLGTGCGMGSIVFNTRAR